jgi:4-amino-4-deoxy-L-arabinose transferase-like glycosyltransferase
MKRIFSSTVVALAAGVCVRLFFALKYPANSGDTVLYEQIAANWLQHHVYAMNVHEQVTPVDMRMPGYPAFLAMIYALSGRTGEAARRWVMLAQVVVDLLTCLLIAGLAALLVLIANNRARPHRVFIAALWLAALCPFTANYTAVPLTEVFATFFTAAALLPLCLLVTRAQNRGWRLVEKHWILGSDYWYLAAGAALLVGLCTLFRPEGPLLLLAAWLVLGVILVRQRERLRWVETAALMAAFCAIPLVPWTIRNALTLHEFQPLAPKNSNLPGELVPYGLMSWEKTWLFRFRDVYLVPWKLNEEVINVDEIPARAFDTPAEKERVAMILDQYNEDLTFTPEEDAAFGQLARERTARRPLRTYVWLPAARALTLWFTPRIELLPFSGTVFPLAQSWEDDPIDQSVTAGLFLLNVGYVALALWGAARLWRRATGTWGAIALLATFIVLRTAFLTTLETPEPRYVLVCYPALLALAAQVFAGSASAD